MLRLSLNGLTNTPLFIYLFFFTVVNTFLADFETVQIELYGTLYAMKYTHKEKLYLTFTD